MAPFSHKDIISPNTWQIFNCYNPKIGYKCECTGWGHGEPKQEE